MKKVLITGGFGFVGSHLVRHLRAQGLEVAVMEHPAAVAPKDIADVQVLRADLTDETALAAVPVAGVDAVLHLGAQSSGPRSFFIPVVDVKLNVLGTLNVVNWCLANNVDRLLFASSFVIYGDHADRAALDESTPCRPKSVYAGSKLAAEHLLVNYAQPKGIRWNALRMFNVYGAGQDITKPDQGVVGIFMNMLRQTSSVQVKGRLDRVRDFINIEDVVRGWDKCLHGAAYNQSFNLGTGEKTTFEGLIRAIANVMHKGDSVRIDELPGTPGDIQGCIADLTRIRKELGYAPTVTLAEGLNTMWRWVEKTMRDS